MTRKKNQIISIENQKYSPDKLDHREIEMLLYKFKGNLSSVKDALGVSRTRLVREIESTAYLKQVSEDCRETFIDNCEQVYHSKALAGDMFALNFLLRTLGAKRGYGSKSNENVQDVLRIAFESVVNRTKDLASDPEGNG